MDLIRWCATLLLNSSSCLNVQAWFWKEESHIGGKKKQCRPFWLCGWLCDARDRWGDIDAIWTRLVLEVKADSVRVFSHCSLKHLPRDIQCTYQLWPLINHCPCYNAHNEGQDVPEALWGQVSRRTRRWSGGEGSGRRRVRPWFTAPWWSLTTTPRPTIMVTKTMTKTQGWGGCQTFLRCDRWGRGCSCPRWASRRGSPRGGPPCGRWCPATWSTWSSWLF